MLLLSMIRILNIALVFKLGGWHVALHNRGLWSLVADREGGDPKFSQFKGGFDF